MEYEYWGYIAKRDDGIWEGKQSPDESPKPIDPSQLREEFKTKIAMLDFMKDYEELPCGSNKVCYSGPKSVAYFLFTEVSSAREDE